MIWYILLALAVPYISFGGVLYFTQRSFIYFPDTKRAEKRFANIPHLRDVLFHTSDGLLLSGWYLPPPHGRPVVLYFHGNSGNLGDRLPWLSRFANAEFGVLMSEYRGYGGNSGSPTEAGLRADAHAALNFLRQQAIKLDQVVFFGESLGASIAICIAAEHPPAALILEAPFTSLSAVAPMQFRVFPLRYVLSDKYDSLAIISRVRCPILILQGQRDEIVPPSHGQALFNAALGRKEIWSAREGGHTDLLDFGAAGIVFDFLRRLDQVSPP